MDTTLSLRRALLANALFSAVCGLGMIVNPTQLAQWLGAVPAMLLQILGAGLLLFAADLLHQATRPRMVTWRALLASLSDVLWVAASVLLLVFFPALLSATGKLIVITVALIVLLCAIWQLHAIDGAHRIAGTKTYRHCLTVGTAASADALWRIVRDMGKIHRYMPTLKISQLLDGDIPGVGATRYCEDISGKHWSEHCTAFDEPGRSFSVRFISEAVDFPFPASSMSGGWSVIPTATGAQVQVWWELIPKRPALAALLLPLLAWSVDRDFPRIIQRMAVAASGGERVADTRPKVRLIPQWC